MNEIKKENCTQTKDEETISLPVSNHTDTVVESVDDLISIAERRLMTMQRLKTVALTSTTPEDWTNQNGKPYLNASGAEKVGRLFGIKISNVTKEKIISQDENGNFYFYVVTGSAHLPGNIDSIEVIGTCSSKDTFFAKVAGQLRSLSEIDETNILKAAYSNFITNAITRLLGIRNLSWEQLTEAGVETTKIARVEYAKGLRGGGSFSQEDKVKQVWIREALLHWARGDEAGAKAKLEELTAFTGRDGTIIKGLTSCNDLKGRRLEIAYEKVKKFIEEEGNN